MVNLENCVTKTKMAIFLDYLKESKAKTITNLNKETSMNILIQFLQQFTSTLGPWL